MKLGSIEILGPRITTAGEICGKIEVEVEKTKKAEWYKVTRDLD